ncbi:MAG TPA: PIG-L family deacetylase [Thermoanaerobaculia bacterium]|jgi:LmbE family N-acetylglucosaminyl deacetylase|nr:PIG-L family deacetylase [Thermoanaerobaculia bacterium]
MTSGSARLLSIRFVAVLLLLAAGGRSAAALPPDAPAGLDFAPTDRILVLAPHPDDEVLGCGGVLQRAVARGIPAEVAFLTYGDSNAWSFLTYRLHPVVEPSAARKMGEVRRQEALSAAAVLGVGAERLTFLGYPDRGTLDLWTSRWGAARPPGRGRLTGARAVPYPTALRPGAPYRGEEVLADLEGLLARFRPTQVFVSHPADHHPDHAALYLFTRVALWDLAGTVKATLHPYLVHFPGWPAPGYRPAEPASPPLALASAEAWQSWGLTPGEVAVKRQALAAHRSQWRSGERHLLPFARATEITGEPPEDEPHLPVRRVGDSIEIALALENVTPKAVRGSLFVFGYRADRPFAGMPKLELRLGIGRSGEIEGCKVLDQGRALPGRPVTVERRGDRLILVIPKALLGGPDRLLVGASSWEKRSLLDPSPWRVVDLAPDDARR